MTRWVPRAGDDRRSSRDTRDQGDGTGGGDRRRGEGWIGDARLRAQMDPVRRVMTRAALFPTVQAAQRKRPRNSFRSLPELGQNPPIAQMKGPILDL